MPHNLDRNANPPSRIYHTLYTLGLSGVSGFDLASTPTRVLCFAFETRMPFPDDKWNGQEEQATRNKSTECEGRHHEECRPFVGTRKRSFSVTFFTLGTQNFCVAHANIFSISSSGFLSSFSSFATPRNSTNSGY